MNENNQEEYGLKAKKHTFLLIVKISVITINICLWIGIMVVSGTFFEEDIGVFGAVVVIILSYFPLFVIIFSLFTIPMYYLYVSFIYLF